MFRIIFILLASLFFSFPALSQDTIDFATVDTKTYEFVSLGKWDSVIHYGKLGLVNDIDYFYPVPENVYKFYIGGYQVLDKFLKDRKGKDIFYEFSHIENIIRVLAFTINQMKLIDEEVREWV